MIVFICNSPFQILSAALIRRTYYPKDRAGIILTDASKALIKFKNSALESLFERIEHIEIYEKMKQLEGYSNMEIPDRRVGEIAFKLFEQIDMENVTDLYYANLHAWIYCLIDLLRNRGIRTHYYEDGMDSYIVNVNVPYIEKPYDIFVYQPELMLENKGSAIRRIPSINEVPSEIQEEIDSVFNTYDTEFNLPDVIFFEQHSDSKDDYKYIDDLFIKINEITNHRAMIKSHPRRRKSDIRIDPYRWVTDTPWELIAYKEELTNKLIIGISSRAMFTIPIMTKDRPMIILLYRLLIKLTGKDIKWWHITDEYVDRWTELYGRGKVLIPNSIEELRQILFAVMERIGDKNNGEA